MAPKWFLIGPDGIDECDSYSQAREGLLELIEPDGEWPEGIDSSSFGVFIPLGQVREINRRKDPDGRFDYLCEYEIVESRADLIARISDLEAEIVRFRSK